MERFVNLPQTFARIVFIMTLFFVFVFVFFSITETEKIGRCAELN